MLLTEPTVNFGVPSSNFLQMDMDLIEILLRQDVDIGVTRDVWEDPNQKPTSDINEQNLKIKIKLWRSMFLVLSWWRERGGTLSTTMPSFYEPLGNVEDQCGSWLLEDKAPPLLGCDPWAGLNYTIDSETGEHIVLDDDDVPMNEKATDTDSTTNSNFIESDLPEDLGIIFNGINLTLDDEITQCANEKYKGKTKEFNDSDKSDRLVEASNCLLEQLKELEEMVQITQPNHQVSTERHSSQQIRLPQLHSMGLEQCWQDLNNVLPIPSNMTKDVEADALIQSLNMDFHLSTSMLITPQSSNSCNYPAIEDRSSVLLQNVTLPPPIDTNLTELEESCVNLCNTGQIRDTGRGTLDMMVANTSQLLNISVSTNALDSIIENNGGDDFLAAVLNETDLLSSLSNMLSDQHLTKENSYSINEDSMDTNSVSTDTSMTSSDLQDDWQEMTSESDQSSYGNPYKYRSCSYASGTQPKQNGEKRTLPVAQKKYQLFGKKPATDPASGGSPYGMVPHGTAAYPQQPTWHQSNVKDYSNASSPPYSNLEGATAPPNVTALVSNCIGRNYNYNIENDIRANPSTASSLEQIQHNHTYQLSAAEDTGTYRPPVRDKNKARTRLEQHRSRDEKRARHLNIPLTMEEIVNLSIDDFNDRLARFELTEAQLSLIRDIRRRGKNKVAAQNCRKRKLNQIVSLAEEIQEVQRDREMALMDQQNLKNEKQKLEEKYSQLYKYIFQSLRDANGNPYTPFEYSLHQMADGNMRHLPRDAVPANTLMGNFNFNHSIVTDDDPNRGAKCKRKDDFCWSNQP